MSLTARHQVVAFYGVSTTSENTVTTTYHRMKNFTQLSKAKNPQEYNRKYVDEATQRTDVTGYATQYDYAFDRDPADPVLADIMRITDRELIGDDAIRSIISVDIVTGAAFERDFAVIPGSEGSDANIYTYSGSFKAHGEAVAGTAASNDDFQTVTFTEEAAATTTTP